jgi:hypothetical protein
MKLMRCNEIVLQLHTQPSQPSGCCCTSLRCMRRGQIVRRLATGYLACFAMWHGTVCVLQNNNDKLMLLYSVYPLLADCYSYTMQPADRMGSAPPPCRAPAPCSCPRAAAPHPP